MTRIDATGKHPSILRKRWYSLALNGLEDVVVPCGIAAHEREGLFPFRCASSEAGRSNSQPKATSEWKAEGGAVGALSELEDATSIEALAASRGFALVESYLTRAAQKKRAEVGVVEDQTHNAVFARAA